MKRLVLISRSKDGEESARLLEIAEWMGVPTTHIEVGGTRGVDGLTDHIDGTGNIVAVGADTLEDLRDGLPSAELQDFVEKRCSKLIVLVTGHSRPSSDVLPWLTHGAVKASTSPVDRHLLRFPKAGRPFSRAFSGLCLELPQPVAIPAFDTGTTAASAPGMDVIMVADEQPMLLRLERGACEIFLVGLNRLPRIDTRVSLGKGVEAYFDQIIPILIVLRACCAGPYWQGVSSSARLIIDDPLLQPTYGFLDFRALQKSMVAAGYGASIAFIPWNHWRTAKEKAAELFGKAANLEICVHGCDHANREFDDVDPNSLQWKTDTALRRMERHRDRTGIPYEPVMVFPQGWFSSPAVLALRHNGFLAAINTSCLPTNADAEPLVIADFLRPAVTKFHGFPIFQRRYPRRLIDSAFDIFLGRPVFIAQHHDDFRCGYGAIEAFVNGLHEIEPTLEWQSLSSGLMKSCMVRSTSEHSAEIRFFTRCFRFRRAGVPTLPAGATNIRFSKEEPAAREIDKVLVDGASVPFTFQNKLLTFDYPVDPAREISIEVLDRPRQSPLASTPPTTAQSLAVPLRRALSEFRDGALVRYPRLLAAATGLARRMQSTRNPRASK